MIVMPAPEPDVKKSLPGRAAAGRFLALSEKGPLAKRSPNSDRAQVAESFPPESFQAVQRLPMSLV
jgi:hypothetical protein